MIEAVQYRCVLLVCRGEDLYHVEAGAGAISLAAYWTCALLTQLKMCCVKGNGLQMLLPVSPDRSCGQPRHR